jgi:hypothetical protein
MGFSNKYAALSRPVPAGSIRDLTVSGGRLS